jgi:hypothetical protein
LTVAPGPVGPAKREKTRIYLVKQHAMNIPDDNNYSWWPTHCIDEFEPPSVEIFSSFSTFVAAWNI